MTMCIYMRVCVCERQRGTDIEADKQTETERETREHAWRKSPRQKFL